MRMARGARFEIRGVADPGPTYFWPSRTVYSVSVRMTMTRREMLRVLRATRNVQLRQNARRSRSVRGLLSLSCSAPKRVPELRRAHRLTLWVLRRAVDLRCSLLAALLGRWMPPTMLTGGGGGMACRAAAVLSRSWIGDRGCTDLRRSTPPTVGDAAASPTPEASSSDDVAPGIITRSGTRLRRALSASERERDAPGPASTPFSSAMLARLGSVVDRAGPFSGISAVDMRGIPKDDGLGKNQKRAGMQMGR